MNAVRLGDVLDPEKNLREWAKRGGENPQKGSPAAAMQWAVAELDAARAELAALRAVADPIETAAEAAQGELEETHAEVERLRAIETAAHDFADSIGIDIGHNGYARYRRLRKSLGLPDR